MVWSVLNIRGLRNLYSLRTDHPISQPEKFYHLLILTLFWCFVHSAVTCQQ